MDFNKCEHYSHKKICKFIEPLKKITALYKRLDREL